MAGDWIKMRNDLAEDPAVIGIAARLGMDEFAVVGRLHHLWGWADRQSRDGHAANVTSAWLDRYVQCDGFASAMATVGWLVIGEDGITIPKFDRHNGKSAKTRALATGRKQKQREKVTPEVTPMSRSERDESVTREEKRREELSLLRSDEGTEQKPATKTKAMTIEALQSEGLDEQTAGELLALRRRHKAPLTPRAWDGIKAEAGKAGWTVERAVLKMLARGWRGFESDWVRGEPQKAESADERRRSNLATLTGRVPQQSKETIDVTGRLVE